MTSTVRSIAADCITGDGSLLEVTTDGQDSDAVLRFRITAPEDSGQGVGSVMVSDDQLAEIIDFLNREGSIYDLEYRDVDEDQEGED